MSIKTWLMISSKLFELGEKYPHSSNDFLEVHFADKNREEKLEEIEKIQSNFRDNNTKDAYTEIYKILRTFYSTENIEPRNNYDFEQPLETEEKLFLALGSFIKTPKRVGIKMGACKLFNLIDSNECLNKKIAELRLYGHLHNPELKLIAENAINLFTPNIILINFSFVNNRLDQLSPYLTNLDKHHYRIFLYAVPQGERTPQNMPVLNISLEEICNLYQDKRCLILDGNKEKLGNLSLKQNDFFCDDFDCFIHFLEVENEILSHSFKEILVSELDEIKQNLRQFLFVNFRKEKNVTYYALLPLKEDDLNPASIYQFFLELKESVKKEIRRTRHLQKVCSYLVLIEGFSQYIVSSQKQSNLVID